MKAYHGDPEVKEKYLARVRAHQAADQLVQNYGYWQDGKGCAVGCTIHGDDHSAYETELGIPVRIAYLEDRLFERMPKEPARTWPERFLNAIPVGADLSNVFDQFIHWLLVDPEYGVVKFAKTDRSQNAIRRVADLYGRRLKGEKTGRDEWTAAFNEARECRVAARARSSAASAAASAEAAAEAEAAAAAEAWPATRYWEIRAEAHLRQSEKLLELLRNAPVAEKQKETK